MVSAGSVGGGMKDEEIESSEGEEIESSEGEEIELSDGENGAVS